MAGHFQLGQRVSDYAFVPPTFNRSYADNIGGDKSSIPVTTRYRTCSSGNLNIQRELPGNIVMDVGYVANRGTRQKDQALAAYQPVARRAASVCPSSRATGHAPAASQSGMEPSPPATAIVAPSGE